MSPGQERSERRVAELSDEESKTSQAEEIVDRLPDNVRDGHAVERSSSHPWERLTTKLMADAEMMSSSKAETPRVDQVREQPSSDRVNGREVVEGKAGYATAQLATTSGEDIKERVRKDIKHYSQARSAAEHKMTASTSHRMSVQPDSSNISPGTQASSVRNSGNVEDANTKRRVDIHVPSSYNLSLRASAISTTAVDSRNGHMSADQQDSGSLRSHNLVAVTSGELPSIIARRVSEKDDPELQIIHAVAKKDSFLELLRHDRRTKIVTGIIVAAIVGLGVGLGIALSGSSTTAGVEEKYTPVGSDIDGPGRAFEHGPGDHSEFGASISMSGDGSRIAIGAPEYSSANGERFHGLVQVFEEQGNDWILLEPSILGMASDMAGTSVALSLDGSTLAVGSPEHAAFEAAKAGRVMVYKRIGETWKRLGQPIVGGAQLDKLGSSVSISEDGSRVAFSVPGNERGADEKAKVYEYDESVDDWLQLGEDLEGRFGGSPLSMSADGNTVAMGSLSMAENDYVGAVRMYVYASGRWRLMGSDIVLKAPKPGSYDVLWTPSLSSDGKTVAIGSSVQNPTVSGEEYGLVVRTFRFNEDVGDWLPLGQPQHDKRGSHLISYVASLSADSSVLVIGDPGGFAMGSGSGHAHVLRFVDDDWLHVDKELEGSAAADHYGEAVSVSADGSRLGIGAPHSRAMGYDFGRVSVYELSELTK